VSLTALIQIGVIPAALVVVAGMLVIHAGPAESAGRRFLFFLLGAGALLLLAVLVSVRLPYRDNRLGFLVSNLLAATILGLLVQILLNLKRLQEMDPLEKALAVSLTVVLILLLVTVLKDPPGMAYYLLTGALLLFLAWWLRGRSVLLVTSAGLALLGLLSYDWITRQIAHLSDPLRTS
jgi:hypothetical protein